MPFDTSFMRFAHPIRELVRARISIRRYTGEPLSGPARQELVQACSALRIGPFGAECRFVLLELAGRGRAAGPRRLGTYGMIRGARSFLAGAVRAADRALEDFGYLLELLVLKATDLGLGTCWLGGTFDRSAFARVIGLREGELLPAVSPVGVSSERRDLLERVIRFGAGSARRLPWAELFFDGRWGLPLGSAEAGVYAEPLEALRLGPSASNRQPWRLVRSRADGRWHLGLQRTPGYRQLTPSDLQRVDQGIAMSHFALAAEACGLPGQWVNDPGAGTHLGGVEYTATWVPI